MGYLSSEKPPEKWSSSYFKKFIERLRTAINYIDSENFPEGINGVLLKPRSVSLRNTVSGYGGLVFNQDFFAGHTAIEITSIENGSVGGTILWSPAWTQYAKVFLEVTAYVSNENYPGTVGIRGAYGDIISQEITNTALARHEWEIEEPPDLDMTLVFRCNAQDEDYPLTILSARLILKLVE